jgi:hypothetical protein
MAIGYLTTAMLFSSCGFTEDSHCENTITSRGKSPDGRYLSTVYYRACDSGSKFTYVKVEEIPPHFWSPSGDYEYILRMEGYHTVSTFWKSPTEMDINCPTSELGKDTTARKDKWKDITFTYKWLADEYR